MCSLVKRWPHDTDRKWNVNRRDTNRITRFVSNTNRFRITDTASAINCAEDTLMGEGDD